MSMIELLLHDFCWFEKMLIWHSSGTKDAGKLVVYLYHYMYIWNGMDEGIVKTTEIMKKKKKKKQV